MYGADFLPKGVDVRSRLPGRAARRVARAAPAVVGGEEGLSAGRRARGRPRARRGQRREPAAVRRSVGVRGAREGRRRTASPVWTAPLALPRIGPRERADVTVPLPTIAPTPRVEYILTVEFVTRDATPLVPKGHVVAWDQFAAAAGRARAGRAAQPHAAPRGRERSTGRDRRAGIDGCASAGRVSRSPSTRPRGAMTSWVFDGQPLIVAPPEPSFWRPPTDNDYGNGQQIRSGDVEGRRPVRRGSPGFDVEPARRAGRRRGRGLVLAGSARSRRRCIYSDRRAGTVTLTESLRPGLSTDLPEHAAVRHATWRLPARFVKATWYGRGPHDSYWDRRTGAAVGRAANRAVADLPHRPMRGRRRPATAPIRDGSR